MSNEKFIRYTFVAAILSLVCLQFPVAAADRDQNGEKVELRAPVTGIESIDENNRDENIENALRRFKELTSQTRDAAEEAGKTIMTLLVEKQADLEKRAAEIPAEVSEKWEAAKARLQALRRDAGDRLNELKSQSVEQWERARDAAALAFERLAAELRQSDRADDKAGDKG